MKSKPYWVLFLGLMLAAAVRPADAQDASVTPNVSDEKRVRIFVNGLYHVTEASFDETSTFTVFLEEGRSERDYTKGTGPAFEVGGIFSITRSFGVMASVAFFSTDVDVTFTEIVPHPLLFDRDRSASGDMSGLDYQETDVHIDAVFTSELGAITLDLFGGPTFFITDTELISEVTTASAYPFDAIEIANVGTTTVSENALGFNVGAALTYRFTDVVGVAFHARYSQGSLSLDSGSGEEIELDAGGFRVGAGIRLAF